MTGGLRIGDRRDHFDAVASRENHAFLDGRIAAQPHQRVAHIAVFESDAFAHFDGRATVIQTDDDDLFLHGLFEPAPMPAGEQGFAPEKVTKHDAESEHGKNRGLLAAQTRGDTPVQQGTIKKPGDSR